MRSVSILAVLALSLMACGGSKQPASSGTGGSGSPTSGGGGGATADGSGEVAPAKDGDAPAAPAVAAEKIDSALPETKDAKPYARRYECGAKGCNLGKLVPDTMTAQLEKDAPVFMFEVVMPPKVSMLIPRHAGVDLYGLLLDGEVSVLADDIKEKQKRAWKHNGFRAPGSGVNIYSKEPTRMILAFVVAGTSGTLAEQIDKFGKDKSITWGKRSSPVTSFELSAKQPVSWGGGAYHARLAYEAGGEGNPPASMTFLQMSKNAPVVEHTHDKEWEFLAIVDGEGELNKKSGGKTAINGSTFASINPGNAHSFKPAGTKPMVAIQMYWPPGPEQRFKKLAEGSK
jgi:mannose-6-phosphate isomerase-like protein (cupin superfamily)